MEEDLKYPIKTFVCFDIETTGLNPEKDKIIEIGAVKVVDKKIVGKFSELVNPKIELPAIITKITGINNNMVKNADTEDNVIPRFLDFAEDHVVIGHNVKFDYSFVKVASSKYQSKFEKYAIDTLELSRYFHKDFESKSLENMSKYYGIHNEHAHRAYDDAKTTTLLYVKLCNTFFEVNPRLFQPKPLFYKIKKSQSITNKQKKYLIDLLKYHNIESEQLIEELTQNEASRWIDQIILTHGRMSK